MSEILDWVIEEGRILIGRAGRERHAPRHALGGTVSERPRCGGGVGEAAESRI